MALTAKTLEPAAAPDHNLVAAVEALVPLLKRNAAQQEDQRQLTPETNDALRQAGIYRMYTPKRFGGFESMNSKKF